MLDKENKKSLKPKKCHTSGKNPKKSSRVTVLVQEIAGPLEASVALPSLTTVTQEQQSSNGLHLQLQPSLSLWHALQRYSFAQPCCM